MQTVRILCVLACGLALIVGCSDDGGGGDPVADRDQITLDEGWAAFSNGDFTTAETRFRDLLARDVLLPEAHDGLGWTFARGSEPDSALTHFEASVAAGAAALVIGDEVQAGLAFVQDAAGDPAACLAAAGAVPDDWIFTADPAVDHEDIVLLEAVSHYALGQFAASLAAVQELDPTFQADVATIAGVADLAARIEALLG